MIVVDNAIRRSVHCDQISKLYPTSEEERREMYETLCAECEDHLEREEGLDAFWGQTESGSEWRVYLGTVES